jgi:hypothetical protein
MTTATVLQILGLRLITFKGENMPYKPNKPQVSDYLSVSASDIQNNFSLLGNMLNPDLGTALFPRQLTGAVTAPTTVGLVARESTSSVGETALHFLPQNGGAAVDFTSAGKAANGWCRLPCGIIMKWGTDTVPAGSNKRKIVTFVAGAGIPDFTAIYSILLTPFEGQAGDHNALYLTTAGGFNPLTQFSAYQDSGVNRVFYYLAIGI